MEKLHELQNCAFRTEIDSKSVVQTPPTVRKQSKHDDFKKLGFPVSFCIGVVFISLKKLLLI